MSYRVRKIVQIQVTAVKMKHPHMKHWVSPKYFLMYVLTNQMRLASASVRILHRNFPHLCVGLVAIWVVCASSTKHTDLEKQASVDPL